MIRRVTPPLLLLVLSTTSTVITLPSYAQGTSMMNDDLLLAVNIEEMRGHLMQALNNKSMGNDDRAVAHAGHPAAEHLADIAPIIEKRDPALLGMLNDRLVRLPAKVSSLSVQEFKDEITSIDALLEDALNLVSDESKKSMEFWLEVIKMLLEHVHEEYEEGVEEEGTVSSIVEYEDAQGMLARAEQVFISRVKDGMSNESSAMVERFFLDARTAMEEKRSADTLKEMIDGIMPVIPEFPAGTMLILAGVIASAVIGCRIFIPMLNSRMY